MTAASAVAPSALGTGLDALVTVTAYVVTLIGWGVTLCLPWCRDEVQFGRYGGLRACAGIAAAGVAAFAAMQAANAIGDVMWRVNTWLAKQPALVDIGAVSRVVAITMGMAIVCCLGVAALCLVGQVMLVLAWAVFGGRAAAGQLRLPPPGWLPHWPGLTCSMWSRLALLAGLLVGQLPVRPRTRNAQLAVEAAQAIDLAMLLLVLPGLLWQLTRCVAASAAASAGQQMSATIPPGLGARDGQSSHPCCAGHSNGGGQRWEELTNVDQPW